MTARTLRLSSGRKVAPRTGRLPVMHGGAAALLLVMILSGTTAAAGQDLKAGELTIRATGFAHARGHAVAKFFKIGDNVRGQARWQMTAPIQKQAAVFQLPRLQADAYAVVVFHDENDNGVIDHGLLGPSEPIGFSGGFILSPVSGMPSFERLKFEFKPPAQTLEVRVR